MKKLIALALVAAMSLTVLVGCGSKKPAASQKTPEELATLYSDAITAHGGEPVQYNPVVTEAKEDDGSAFMLEMLGLKEEDLKAFGISASLMNVHAFTIAAVMPAEGKSEDVKQALEAYVAQKQSEFEFYLADQYEIAKAAKVEVLEDGTVLMVMAEDSDTVTQNITKAILGK